jgi:hypothetical protein
VALGALSVVGNAIDVPDLSPAFEKHAFWGFEDSGVIEFFVDLTGCAKIQNPIDPVAETGDG